MAQHLKNEKEVHHYVKFLKNFYGELSVYVLSVTVSLIVWLLCGGGYFWPLWLILIWGVILALKASRLRIITPALYHGAHKLRENLPFIRPQWEGEKTQEIMKSVGRAVSETVRAELKTKGPSTKKKSAPKKKAAKRVTKK